MKTINELGRSMVEMLGVLAIIGVLSMTGVLMFSTAMAKHKANEAAQQVNMARIQLEESATLGSQAGTSFTLPRSYVTLADGAGYSNVGMQVDFKEDVKACKQFVLMYKDSSEYYVLNKCEE